MIHQPRQGQLPATILLYIFPIWSSRHFSDLLQPTILRLCCRVEARSNPWTAVIVRTSQNLAMSLSLLGAGLPDPQDPGFASGLDIPLSKVMNFQSNPGIDFVVERTDRLAILTPSPSPRYHRSGIASAPYGSPMSGQSYRLEASQGFGVSINEDISSLATHQTPRQLVFSSQPCDDDYVDLALSSSSYGVQIAGDLASVEQGAYCRRLSPEDGWSEIPNLSEMSIATTNQPSVGQILEELPESDSTSDLSALVAPALISPTSEQSFCDVFFRRENEEQFTPTSAVQHAVSFIQYSSSPDSVPSLVNCEAVGKFSARGIHYSSGSAGMNEIGIEEPRSPGFATKPARSTTQRETGSDGSWTLIGEDDRSVSCAADPQGTLLNRSSKSRAKSGRLANRATRPRASAPRTGASGRTSRPIPSVQTYRSRTRNTCLVPGCNKKFGRPEHRQRHHKTHDPMEMKKNCPCFLAECPKLFTRYDNAKAHLLTHMKKNGKTTYIPWLTKELCDALTKGSTRP